MARHSKGILGGFSGKVGTVVGSNWNGLDVMRSRPIRKKNPTFTEKQRIQQAKFSLGIKFITSISGLLETTYQPEFGKTIQNTALGNILNEAITGVYPNLSINYSLVLISSGNLNNVTTANVNSASAGAINFSWTDNTGTGNALATDKAILVVYCPELQTAVYTTAGAERSQQADALLVPLFSGKQVHSWLAFRTANGSRIARSRYTGSFQVM